ncbi:MAG: hypothetical protein HGA37_04710 [Lentimicrobium sp.]|nr:hypothetical protein [Lentimicrobium sp.]
MKTEQLLFTERDKWQIIHSQNDCSGANLVLLFGSRQLLKQKEHIDYIKSLYPQAELIGASTSGEICCNEVHESSIVSTAILFDKTRIKVVKAEIKNSEDSFNIGHKLAEELKQDGLVHVMVFSEGLNINGSELTKGLNKGLGNLIPVTGGLAGDQADFIETVLVHNEPGQKNLIVAIGFYGENIRIGYGSEGGWDSFGVDRLVTRSKANILYELDGQPALELYKKYLGDHARALPASALLFPLSLRFRDSETSVVRTVLSVNEHDGSMVFAGDIPEGEYVRLMKVSFDKLIGGAVSAAEMTAINMGVSNPALAVLISCVGRKLVLKQRVEEEIEAVRDVLGAEATITGFYSYGEISPAGPFEHRCELHNQTMTITVFKEV